MINDENKAIINRLDSIIALLLENLTVSGLVGKGRAIEVLHSGGLGPSEIGKILGMPTTSVGSILTKQKMQKRKHKKSKE